MHLVLLKGRKRKKYRTLHASSEPIAESPENPNDVSISDAKTQSGNEPETSDNVNDKVHDEGNMP